MNKCECYEEKEVVDSCFYIRRLVGICNGTKERDECRCGGNPAKCDFYSEIREKAYRQTQEYRDVKELEFYRWWITKHNLNVEVATAFERWLNEQKV
nr:MAG TPA: hypothetical protein [Caudoviricetes sp.]